MRSVRPFLPAMRAVAICATGLVAAVTAPAQELYVLDASAVPAANERGAAMSLREVERAADHSLVEVTQASGGSVASSMFVLKGLCGLARARGETYFSSADEGQSPRRYRVSFPPHPDPATLTGRGKSVFSLDDCGLLGF